MFLCLQVLRFAVPHLACPLIPQGGAATCSQRQTHFLHWPSHYGAAPFVAILPIPRIRNSFWWLSSTTQKLRFSYCLSTCLCKIIEIVVDELDRFSRSTDFGPSTNRLYFEGPWVIKFLPRDSMRKRGLCCRPVSVRPSVTMVYWIQTARLSPTRPGSPIILVFWPRAPILNSQENPIRGGARYTGVAKFCDFSTEVAVYLGNGAR